jgi:hypothetical protein
VVNAAEALGDLHADDAAIQMEEALAVEPVSWARQKIEESLKK